MNGRGRGSIYRPNIFGVGVSGRSILRTRFGADAVAVTDTVVRATNTKRSIGDTAVATDAVVAVKS